MTDAAGANAVGAPHFAVASGAANPFDGIDIGFDSTPALADVDGDGDLDAFIGWYNGILNFYENTGSATVPVYIEQTGAANPFNSIDIGHLSSPTFGDGDGKLDVVVGEAYSGLIYFHNTGTATAPVYVEQIGISNPFDGIVGGTATKPTLADGDGDLDLLVGGNSGALYFQNTGSATVPAYVQQTGVANPFDGIVLNNYSAPTLADIDGDGDLDAIVGNRGGGLITLINNATPIITVNVTAEAEIDVANNDAFTTNETTVITAGNLFADNGSGADTSGASVTEVNGIALSVGAQITLASGALLTVNSNGTFDYNPNGVFDELGAAGSGASNTPPLIRLPTPSMAAIPPLSPSPSMAWTAMMFCKAHWGMMPSMLVSGMTASMEMTEPTGSTVTSEPILCSAKPATVS